MRIFSLPRFYITVFLILSSFSVAWAEAQTYRRSDMFKVPAAMRERVDFWKDIFAKYGKSQYVFHHRNYPGAVFSILDLENAESRMSPRSYDRHKKAAIKEETERIRGALRKLASGAEPVSNLERRIVFEMSSVPGGSSKYNKVVKEKLIRAQQGIKEKYAEAIKRSGKYLHVIEKIFVADFGLPIELTRLPFVESSFDYKAYSSVGAAGIWQFMRRTGRLYMRVNNIVDERRDPVEATRAAAKYLRSAYKTLGNWPLALTSYNHGVYGVSKKVKQLGTRDIVKIVEHPTKRVFGFASNNFYAEFLAALEIYDDYHAYFPNVQRQAPMKFKEYKLSHSTSVKYIMNKLGIDAETLKDYNYGLTKNVWSGRYRIPAGYNLKVPLSYSTKLAALRAPEPRVTTASSVYGGAVYRVRRGDTLSRIAKRYGVSVSKLKSMNNLRSDLVRVGQVLVVKPRESGTAAKSTVSTTSTPSTYRVRRGDSLSKIASKFGTSVSMLRSLNSLSSSKIKVGQVLKITGSTQSSSAKSYRVRPGDTLWSIGRKFGVSISSIKNRNGMRSNTVIVGQQLKIP